MKIFIDPKSRAFRFLSWVVDLFLLNLLTLLTCIPVITVGPSILALNATIMKMLNDECSSPTREYFYQFKKELKRGFQLSGFLLAVLLLSYLLIGSLTKMAGIQSLIGIFSLAMFAFLVVILVLYLFPYNARYDDSFLRSIRASYQISALNWKSTVYLLGTIAVALIIFSYNNVLFALGSMFLLFFGISSLAYFSCRLLLPVFKQYE